MNNEKGFTLPELLVTICLLSLLSSFLLQCFSNVAVQHRQRMALLELEDNLMLAITALAEDAGRSTAVLHCKQDELALQQEKVIYYSLGDDQQMEEHFYPLEGKILYRRENTQWNRQPMANFLTALHISYLDGKGQMVQEAHAVRAVVLCVEAQWQGKTLQQTQVVRLLGDRYL